MLNACATALTEKLLCRFPMVRVRRAIYIYGFEITISSLAVMLSVFILSCLCGAVYTSFTFSLIFVSIRLFSGGYHAKTYGRCFILSNAVYLICFDAARLIQTLRIEFLCPFLVLSSMAVVFMLTPIKNKNHPMSSGFFVGGCALLMALLSIQNSNSCVALSNRSLVADSRSE